MAGEHVILLDEQDQPAGMLEKYAAHTFDTLYISRFPAGCLTSRVSYWSLAVRWAKSGPGMDQLGLRTPQQGETFEQAVTRRCRFELGVEISDIAPVHPSATGRSPQTVSLRTKCARYMPRAW